MPGKVLPVLFVLASASLLSACGGGHPVATYTSHGYDAPGPPSDPWGPYITEASRRFDVPSNWIRAVMHQESGGHEYLHGQPITSDAGAAGLLQVMPATYAELADRFHLGPDPYEPHDNIMAGTGYIRDLYDRYGSPTFLAAYNAGPHRVDTYLAGRGELPSETVNYVASIAPNLSQDRPLTGKLAVYAESGRFSAAQDPVPRGFAAAPPARCWQDPDAAYDPAAPCRAAPPLRLAAYVPPRPGRIATSAQCWQDPDAAYDPTAPCRSAPPAAIVAYVPSPARSVAYVPSPARSVAYVPSPARSVAYVPSPARSASVPHGRAETQCWHDPDAAYDPAAPCRSPPAVQPLRPPAPASAGAAGPDWQRLLAISPNREQLASATRPSPAYLLRTAQAAPVNPALLRGRWGIQVGAFADPGQARRIADSVRSLAPGELGGAQAVLGRTSPFGGRVLYRARLVGLSASGAARACRDLAAQAQSCATVPPGA